MTRKTHVRSKAFLRAQRKQMAEIRARKRHDGECRQCRDPVHVDSQGNAMASCPDHLIADAQRVAKRYRKAKRNAR